MINKTFKENKKIMFFVVLSIFLFSFVSLNVNAISVPSYVSYQGKILNGSSGVPVTGASLRINVTSFGNLSDVIWGPYDFINVTNSQGVFDLILGSNNTLSLVPGIQYMVISCVDLDGNGLSNGCDSTFGSNKTVNDLIVISSGGPRNANELLLSNGSVSVESEFSNYVLKSYANVTGNLSVSGYASLNQLCLNGICISDWSSINGSNSQGNSSWNESYADTKYVMLNGTNASVDLGVGNITANNGFFNIAFSYITNLPSLVYGLWESKNDNNLLVFNGTHIGYNATVLNDTIIALINSNAGISSGNNFNNIVGTTTGSYSGNITIGSNIGYVAANSICNQEFSGSHFCLEVEILKSIANGNYSFTGTYWMQKGAPGYTANADDCQGWTTGSSSYLGAFWNWDGNSEAGYGRLTNCAQIKKLMCCG